MTIQCLRTSADEPDFRTLVALLDAELAVRDGDDHAFYSQYNQLDHIRQVVVAFANEQPVGCGALKAFAPGVMEVKRMYVRPEWRGQGVASRVLAELENWASELAIQRCVLETGIHQPEAIQLYLKNGYTLIPNYGQYVGIVGSKCFAKQLDPRG